MRNTILSITLAILYFPAFVLTAQTGESENYLDESDIWLSHLSESQHEILLKEKELSHEISNGESLDLLPITPVSGQRLPGTEENFDEIRRKMKRYFGIEGLFFLPGDNSGLTETEAGELMLKVYNLTRGVSTLEGTDYYSASRGYRRTLFKRFFRIGETGDRSPMEDPLVDTIPESDSFLVFQEDSTFGEDEYEITYNYSTPAIDLTMKNMTPLNYSILPVAGREKLYMYVRIVPVAEGYIFYGSCLVEGRKIPVPGKNINDSLYNRIKALMEWFERQLQAEI